MSLLHSSEAAEARLNFHLASPPKSIHCYQDEIQGLSTRPPTFIPATKTCSGTQHPELP